VKTETLVARVTPDLAQKVQNAAIACGETDAYVIREALREYFSKRDAVTSANLKETPAAPAPSTPIGQPVSYRKTKPRK